MSASQEIARCQSSKDVKRTIKELSFITRLPELRIRELLHEYTMTEIRNGSMVAGKWVPLESVKVDKNL